MADADEQVWDYIVVGGGGSGMSFIDTLQTNMPGATVALIDEHSQPGGQWNDSYSFVRLHQPSFNYGVVGAKLEPEGDKVYRSTRPEILSYYERVLGRMAEGGGEGGRFQFFGQSRFLVDQAGESDARGGKTYAFEDLANGGTLRKMTCKKLVDARFLQPDLPIFVKAKFAYGDETRVIPANSLPEDVDPSRFYVVVGAGKTGMDSCIFLQNNGVPLENILWLMPNDAWLSCRETLVTCMEFMDACIQAAAGKVGSLEFLQGGYLSLEAAGKMYRMDPAILPSKFKDATLDKDELATLRKVTNILRGRGRLQAILPNGDMHFVGGTTVPLSHYFGDRAEAAQVTYVHCSAGAFNFSSATDKVLPLVFTQDKITVLEAFGNPGFLFNAALIARVECETSLSDEEKNKLVFIAPCHVHEPETAVEVTDSKRELTEASHKLGPSGGDISAICCSSHPMASWIYNACKWYSQPAIAKWLHDDNRMYNLKHLTEEKARALVQANYDVLRDAGLMKTE